MIFYESELSAGRVPWRCMEGRSVTGKHSVINILNARHGVAVGFALGLECPI